MNDISEALVETLRQHQYDLNDAILGIPTCTCGEAITRQPGTPAGVDRDLARHQIAALFEVTA